MVNLYVVSRFATYNCWASSHPCWSVQSTSGELVTEPWPWPPSTKSTLSLRVLGEVETHVYVELAVCMQGCTSRHLHSTVSTVAAVTRWCCDLTANGTKTCCSRWITRWLARATILATVVVSQRRGYFESSTHNYWESSFLAEFVVQKDYNWRILR